MVSGLQERDVALHRDFIQPYSKIHAANQKLDSTNSKSGAEGFKATELVEAVETREVEDRA